MSDLSKIKLVDGTILNLKDSESRQLIEDNKVIANPNKSPTRTLTKIEIGKDVYNIPSEGGGTVLDLIWDNDDDPGQEGKLYKYPNGQLIIENIDTEYTYLDVYYSELGTSKIQYFKMATYPLLKEHIEGNKNVGMFYILKVNGEPLFNIEQVTIEFDKVEEDNYKITVSTLINDTTNSKVKIERIYGGM